MYLHILHKLLIAIDVRHRKIAFGFFLVVVVVVTSAFWIPISCLISYYDRKKLRHEMKLLEWRQKLDLIHPTDRRRVIHIR